MNEFLFTAPAVTPSTAEEVALLEAHLGLYEDHVRAFEEFMMDREYATWLAAQQEAAEYQREQEETMQ